jgi:hypothetical protein
MKRSVLLTAVIGLIIALAMPPAAVAEPRCAEGWNFSQVRKKRVRMLVHERRRIENKSDRTAQVTFDSRKSKTVRMSLSVSVEAGYDAVFASVKAKVDATVERSVTAEVGEKVTYSIKPSRAAIGRYGIFIRPVKGRLTKGDSSSNCRYDRRITAYLPRESGWRVSDVAIKQ